MANNCNKFITDAKLLIALWENSPTNVLRHNIADCIENGADVNVKFANNANNTPLHIAVIRGDKEIVNILLRYGAKPNVANDDGKTALELAKELPECTDIVKLLEAHKELNVEAAASSVAKDALATVAEYRYKKRPGTANIRGQLYETKLLTLAYLRASRCRQNTQFYLGTNVDKIGDMDDLCLRCKAVNDDYVIFLQAKHKYNVLQGRIGTDDLERPSGDFSLLKYFDSYKKTRFIFDKKSDNEVFRGSYEDIKCHYVMFTTVKDEIESSRKKPVVKDSVMDLISTGEHNNVFQLRYDDQYINLLTKAMMTERIKDMGRTLFKSIQNNKHETMLSDENIRSFHVVLARNVMNVTEVNRDGLRTGTFREEFFSSNDELLILLRETMYKEAAKNSNLTTSEIKVAAMKIYLNANTETISELIGNSIYYDCNTNTLKFQDIVDEQFSSLQNLIDPLQIPQTVINDAFELSGRKKLCSLTFNLPAAFGNLDMTVNKIKAERRLKYLANKISDVINESADVEGNVVLREGMYATNKWLTTGELAINGGIAGAVGNLLISDENKKLKFNLEINTLPENAKKLLMNLKERIIDLERYRFITENETFPLLSFHATENEKTLVTHFFDSLYFYTCQATEDQLEDIVTKELQAHECSDSISKSESLIRSNALFLKIHNEIQIWWMMEPTAPFLTQNTFYNISRDWLNSGLLTYLKYIYINEINRDGLEFESDAVQVLSVCGRDTRDGKTIVIHTDVHLLTCHKLVQYYRGAEDYLFVDTDYLNKMPPNCFKTIIYELTNTNINNIIIICEDVSKCGDIIGACGTKKIILVTSSNDIAIDECIMVKDDRINLTDLTEASQRKVLQTPFIFQGIEVTFAEVFDNDMKHLVNSKILEKLMNKDHITMGQTQAMSTYEEIKHFYVPRTLKQNERSFYDTEDFSDMGFEYASSSEDENRGWNDKDLETERKFSPSTLIDHRNNIKSKRKSKMYDIILIIDAPGMGKSTLLTHLSLETKRRYPKVWIQRINLIDYTKQFYEWHEKKIKVDSIEALKFVCKVVMSEESYKGNVRVTCNNNDIHLEVVDGEIKLINREKVDPVKAFELDTFIHCFYEGQIVFLFDGFDEICPHYKTEVTQLLKYLARRTRMYHEEMLCFERKRSEQCVWITSRPYNDLRETLENTFGESYTLQPFSYKAICIFFDKYMRRNLDLNTLTTNQLMNINGFFEYMKRFDVYYSDAAKDVALVNIPLHSVYVAAMEYFKSEIKRSHVPDHNLVFIREWDVEVNKVFAWLKHLGDYERFNDVLTLSGVPLHVYIAIHFFLSQVIDTTITDAEALINQWDLDTNVFAFYERFIETKLKTIRFEEKNRMDLYNPDVKMAYEREKREFLDKHKKLAFYTTCDESVFTSDELEEVKELIRRMKNGEEKTGLVDRIVDDKPRFVHYTFAEYFVVEYVFDCIKSTELRKQGLMLEYILKNMVFWATRGILNLFDLKIKFDSAFVNAISSDDVNNSIFELLVGQSNVEYPYDVYEDYIGNPEDLTATFLDVAVRKNMRHFSACLVNSVTTVVDDTKLASLMSIIQKGTFLKRLITSNQYDLVGKILDCIRKIDASNIDKIFPYSLFDDHIHSQTTNEDFIEGYKLKLLQKYLLSLQPSRNRHMSS